MKAAKAAVVAKARAKYGNFLTLSDYKSLILKGGVNEIITALKSYPAFSEEFSSVGNVAVRRKQAEEMLAKRLFKLYGDLLRFEFADKNGFFYYRVRREEIKQIVNAVMLLSAGVGDMFILQFPVFLKDYCSFDIGSLASVRDFSELMLVLKNTPYYDVLRPLQIEKNDIPDIRTIENALNRYYFDWLLESTKKFPSGEREELKKVILRTCDLYNIRLCYRYKGILGLSGEMVMNNRIPHSLRFSKLQMENLLLKSDNETIMKLISGIPYFKKFSGETQDFELLIRKSNLDYYAKKLRMSQYDSVVLHSLMELSELENTNLTTVIEGVRYSLTSDSITEMLVCEK